MVKLIRSKVKASTIMESIVALTLIMIIFSISMMVYINVQRTTFNNRDLELQLIIDKMEQEYREKMRMPGVYELENGLSLELKYADTEYKSLGLVEFKVKDQIGKILATRKHFVYEDK